MYTYRAQLEKGLDEEEEPLLFKEPLSEADEPCCYAHSEENQNDRPRRFCQRWGPGMYGERDFIHRRRVVYFLFAGVILYFLARFVVLDVTRFAGIMIKRQCAPFFGTQNEMSSSNPEDELPDNFKIGDCTTWSEPSPPDHHPFRKGPQQHPHQFLSTATLLLPLDSAKLFILSRGPSDGALSGLHIVQSDEAGDKIKITTTVEFDPMRQLERAKVCLVDGDEGEHGVAIFTHRRRGRHGPHHRRGHELAYRVLVELPRGADGNVVKIPNFSTDMPFFAQFVDNISETVSFDTLSLQSRFFPIHVKSLSAQKANIGSEFGPVEGNFVLNKSLIISTWNSPINISATLNNADGDEPTKLVLETRSSHITASMHLVSTAESGTGGSYAVVATGKTSAINLKFLSAPVDSELKLSAETTLSPVDIHLHPTYEGSFSLATSWADAEVNVDEKQEDPAKKARKRDVRFDRVGVVTRGVIQWDEDGKDHGSVNVSTTYAPVMLSL